MSNCQKLKPERILKAAKEVTGHIHGLFGKIPSRFLLRLLADRKAVRWILKIFRYTDTTRPEVRLGWGIRVQRDRGGLGRLCLALCRILLRTRHCFS